MSNALDSAKIRRALNEKKSDEKLKDAKASDYALSGRLRDFMVGFIDNASYLNNGAC